MRSLFLAALAAVPALVLGACDAARAADGAALYNDDCAVCHSTDPGVQKFGPSLAGVVGRKAGAIADFDYSPAMAKSGLTWDKATLDKFIANPQGLVPGTKMTPALKKAGERKTLIDYLATLKG